MARIPIALELYSVRHELQKDLRGTLQAVAQMGYEGVEFAGEPQHSAEEIKAALDEVGLVCCSWHTPFHLVKDDKLAETIAFNQALGNKSIIIPGLPGHMTATREDWLKVAAFFNELAAKLAPHGMFTGYHNHHTEFRDLGGGETPWDVLFSNTGKEVVMQLDLGNAMRGGAEVVPFLRRYPGRARSIHLKPYSLTAGKTDPNLGYKPLIGEDDVPWDEVFQLCEAQGTEWYIVEYESDAYPPLQAVELCLKALKGMGR
jgi:sugar phosphate isomerase/epimerase